MKQVTMKQIGLTLLSYIVCAGVLLVIAAFDLPSRVPTVSSTLDLTSKEFVRVICTPTPQPLPTVEVTPTPTPVPTTPVEILIDEPVSNQEFYDTCVARGMITPANDYDDRITAERGGYMGPSGRETYYNLKMDLCVYYMRELGYDEEEYPYWIRDDGAKMLGNYVMCAANWKIRPKGAIIPTSLGDAIVVDTGEFVADYPNGVDLAVDW